MTKCVQPRHFRGIPEMNIFFLKRRGLQVIKYLNKQTIVMHEVDISEHNTINKKVDHVQNNAILPNFVHPLNNRNELFLLPKQPKVFTITFKQCRKH